MESQVVVVSQPDPPEHVPEPDPGNPSSIMTVELCGISLAEMSSAASVSDLVSPASSSDALAGTLTELSLPEHQKS